MTEILEPTIEEVKNVATKTADGILGKYKTHETSNGNDAVGYDNVIEAMKEMALMAYDAGFRYAAENFRNQPKGDQTKSVKEFMEAAFYNENA